MQNKTLSIIIPVFNERETFIKLLEKVESVRLPQGIEKEIIIVDDKSTDGTSEILTEHASRFNLIVHAVNSGKGAAVKTGLLAARGDAAIIQDADLEYDPNDYGALVTPVLSGAADVVYGSRFLGRAHPQQMAIINFLANKLLTWWSNLMTGLALTDMETCYKVLSRKVIDDVAPKLVSMRFGIEPELTALIKKYRIMELPVSYLGRTSDEGKKIGWMDGIESLWEVLRFNLRENLRGFDWKPVIVIALALVAKFIFLPPHPTSDSQSYIDALNVMKGFPAPSQFVPNRILTAPVGLSLVRVFEFITNHLLVGWAVLNSIFFAWASYVWYKLVKLLTKDKHVALAGLALFATNYALLTFGLGFLMDMGGWLGFILAAYATLLYMERPRMRYVILSALSVGILGLIKEYAFFALVLFGLVMIYRHLYEERNWSRFAKRVAALLLISLGPVAIAWVSIWLIYDYSYLDWWNFNNTRYARPGLMEYAKVFGSLFTFGWALFLLGLFDLKKTFDKRDKFFLGALFLSTIVLVVWPVITQRIQFMALLAPIIVAGLAFKRRNLALLLLGLLVLYAISNYTMDSFLLPHVNLDAIFD